MQDDIGRELFSFATIADTHFNQGEDECNSPFNVNQLANARMRHVVRDLNLRDLAFVVHLGDLVHPTPSSPDLQDAAVLLFKQQVSALCHRLYLAPGNHDVGDKPNDWAPAACISEHSLERWERQFERHFQSFDHQDCHFVTINAQLINSGLPAEEAQRTWLEADLNANRGRRIFLHSHYPPYLSRRDEEESYDNIGEPGRAWLLNLLETHGIEAMFTAHVHNFWYSRFSSTDCYWLPSTSFVRQDYSEMYRVAPNPGQEFGRNDAPKLGYSVIHVHERGHVFEMIRTNGATEPVGGPEIELTRKLAPVHPKLNRFGDFGFDMRQNWMEIVEIPPTGGLDEFNRKEARNDYPLLALWDMGVRRVRIPMRDLVLADHLARLRELRAQGHEFTLFSFGNPSPHHRELIRAHQDLLVAWEIGVNLDVLHRVAGGIGEIAREVGLPVFLSRLRSRDEQRAEAGKFYHAINHGFMPDDRHLMDSLLASPELHGAIAGIVFRLALDRTPWEVAKTAEAIASELDIAASVHLRTSGANPALETANEIQAANRLAESVFAARAFGRVRIFADTLADNDRGYFPRLGAFDRFWNPRLGSFVVRHLNAVLNAVDGPIRSAEKIKADGAHCIALECGAETLVLVMPEEPDSKSVVPELALQNATRRIDLETGFVADLDSGSAEQLKRAFISKTGAPVLFVCRSSK